MSSWLRAIARVQPVHLMSVDYNGHGGRQPSDQANQAN